MSNKENIKMYELQNFGTKNGLWGKKAGDVLPAWCACKQRDSVAQI
jgi:hypothetical protein